MFTRRNLSSILAGVLVVGATGTLAACGSNAASGNVSSIPTLAQVQAYVSVLNTELPAFVQESINTGLIKAGDVAKANLGVSTFQTLAAQILAPTFNTTNVTSIVAEAGAALTTVAAVVPATAPYIGFIQLAVLLISGFIAASPVAVPPAPPAPVALAAMHKATVSFKK